MADPAVLVPPPLGAVETAEMVRNPEGTAATAGLVLPMEATVETVATAVRGEQVAPMVATVDQEAREPEAVEMVAMPGMELRVGRPMVEEMAAMAEVEEPVQGRETLETAASAEMEGLVLKALQEVMVALVGTAEATPGPTITATEEMAVTPETVEGLKEAGQAETGVMLEMAETLHLAVMAVEEVPAMVVKVVIPAQARPAMAVMGATAEMAALMVAKVETAETVEIMPGATKERMATTARMETLRLTPRFAITFTGM